MFHNLVWVRPSLAVISSISFESIDAPNHMTAGVRIGLAPDSARRGLSGNDLERAHSLLENGRLSDAEKLYAAITGPGTTESTIR